MAATASSALPFPKNKYVRVFSRPCTRKVISCAPPGKGYLAMMFSSLFMYVPIRITSFLQLFVYSLGNLRSLGLMFVLPVK
jgi:hypothetical protein